MLELQFLNQAEKFLKKLKKSDIKSAKQIIIKIVELQSNPKPTDSKDLVNYYPFRRIRIAKYRVVYRYDEKTVYVTIVEKRDTIYKQLNKLL